MLFMCRFLFRKTREKLGLDKCKLQVFSLLLSVYYGAMLVI